MIWCDMDGVLTDIEIAYSQKFGVPAAYVPALPSKVKWDNVRSDPMFFRYLPWMLDGREIWSTISNTGAHILTAVAKSIPECGKQKVEWCRRELGIGTDRIVLVGDGKDKPLYCIPGDVLLDDKPEIVAAWSDAGGQGILVTPDNAVEAARTALGIWRRNQ